MPSRGVHFALSDKEVDRLRGLPNGDRPRYVSDVIEEDYFAHHREWLAESDKAWDAIHRALTDGRLACAQGTYPLNLVILGGEQLSDDAEHHLSLKTPQQVRDVDPRLAPMMEHEFGRRYFAIDAGDYEHDLDDIDFGYSWDWFRNIRDLWHRAAFAGRWILFTVNL